MALYSFKRLIEKYSNPFTLEIYPEPIYEAGEPVRGKPKEIQAEGAILPVTSNKVYQSGGTITKRDRMLYMLNAFPAALAQAKVVYRGQRYSVEEEGDYTDFADVSLYLLKWKEEVGDGANSY